MKNVMFLVCLTLSGFLYSCNDGSEWVEYMVNEPVFMSADEFRNTITVSDVPQDITQQGKICFYNGYLYISEPGKGIHIIDNRKPSNPQTVGFIEIQGNADMAVRNDLLYADAYTDLVWFNISNPAKPELINRLENVFTHSFPEAENGYGYDYGMCYTANGERKGVVVGWTVAKRYREVEKYDGKEYMADASPGSSMSNGVNGSMSRFSIYQDNLYVVINNLLSIFKLSEAKPVKAVEDLHIGGNVETIFSYKDCMFFGTPTGMIIYSVSNPLVPEYQSTVWHIFGCDPVVVDNDLAYVTVHSGNMCGQNNNELMIIDVTNTKQPKLLVTYAMTRPKGLGIDKETLFVCDDGLKIYKIGDPQQLMANRLVHYPGMDGYDIIPHNDVAMMIAEDGLYQYSYSNLDQISLLSKIGIKN